MSEDSVAKLEALRAQKKELEAEARELRRQKEELEKQVNELKQLIGIKERRFDLRILIGFCLLVAVLIYLIKRRGGK